MTLHSYLPTINDFIEDTSVIVATAYGLGRGLPLSVLFQDRVKRRDAVLVGALLGAIAATEVIFPGERYPYLTDTLTTGFATLTGGPLVGLVCAGVVSLTALCVPLPHFSLMRVVDVLLTVVVCGPLRRRPGGRLSARKSLVAAMLAQSAVECVRLSQFGIRAFDWYGVGAIAGNSLGMLLMTAVLNEALVRVESEQNRIEAAQSRALAAKAQLVALRARIHPHFLYNALSSIAGLCGSAPDEAEEATVQLGELMRRTLETSATSTIALAAELEHVHVFAAIEQRRFGSRMRLVWDVADGCAMCRVPPLSLQTLVENAVQHGVGRLARPVTITVEVRRGHGRVLLSVTDDGPGMADSIRRGIAIDADQAVHGLQILSKQLTIEFGPAARLRVFSSPEGTLVVFAIPEPQNLKR
ncbi:MAG: sensor histidine kinase [Capsulimonadaceae bacterium]